RACGRVARRTSWRTAPAPRRLVLDRPRHGSMVHRTVSHTEWGGVMEAGQGAPKVDMADPSEDVQPEKESTSRISRSAVIAFCLVAGLTYRASVSLVPAGIAEDGFVLGLAGLLLVLAMLSRRAQRLRRFWEIPFAFFVFTIAGFFGDGMVSPLQHLFVKDVLHETTSANNPLSFTIQGTVWAQLTDKLLLALT